MNNFKTGKNLFGISSYGSSGLFVDLLTNQSISGIKRFLSNLITNTNINFNTTGNIGRIVFKPNEPAGFGGNLVAIYTADENDGSGWIFDSSGFLYYIGTGFISQKIVFDPTGQINAIGAITGGSLSAGTGTISTSGAISGGSLFTASGPITGGAGNFASVNANSGLIQTTGNINCATINCSTTLKTNTIQPYTGTTINVNSTTSNFNWLLSSGINRIKFFPTVTPAFINNIIEIYKIGDTTPLDGFLSFDNTGLLQYKFNNISQWSISATGNIIALLSVSAPTITASTSLNTNLINASTGTVKNSIQMDNRFFNTGIGSIDLKSTYIGFPHLSQVLSTVSKYMAILPQTDGNFNISINNIASRVLFSNWSTLTLSSEFGFSSTRTIQTTSNIVAGNGLNVNAGDINAFGNIEMLSTAFVKSGFANFNTINPYSGTTINIGATSNFNFLKSVGVNRILMFPSSSSGDIFQITRTGANAYGDGYWFWNNIGECGYISASATRWIINAGGAGTFASLTAGSGSITCGTLFQTSNIMTGSTFTMRTQIAGTCSPNALQMANLPPTPFGHTNYYLIDGNVSGEGVCLYLNDNICGINSTVDNGYQMIFFDEDNFPAYVGVGIAGTSIISYSERRFKDNIKTLDNTNILDKFKSINFVEYTKKRPAKINKKDNPLRYENSKYKYSLKNYGVIHDEIINIFPDLETTDAPLSREKDEKDEDYKKRKITYDNADKSKMIDYGKLNYYSYLAVQELIKQNQEMSKHLNKQDEIIQNLITRLEILENK